jgi:squalene-hopene/tetraprenyl-beta-curcumene cyclase
VEDTARVLLAIRGFMPAAESDDEIVRSARSGIEWLLEQQNPSGGWPTLCAGWSAFPLSRSASDNTAWALRALRAWTLSFPTGGAGARDEMGRRMAASIQRGISYLTRSQRQEGSWSSIWVWNSRESQRENAVYGTSLALLALADVGRTGSPSVCQGLRFLESAQNRDGGWGGAAELQKSGLGDAHGSTLEATAVAVEALLAMDHASRKSASLKMGLEWLIDAVENMQHKSLSTMGIGFPWLWHYERLNPLLVAASALGRALAGRAAGENIHSAPKESAHLVQ